MFEPAILLGAVTILVSGIVWAVRVEGRVNGHDRLFEERDKLHAERDKNLLERHDELSRRLERIEQKIDQGFGNGKAH